MSIKHVTEKNKLELNQLLKDTKFNGVDFEFSDPRLGKKVCLVFEEKTITDFLSVEQMKGYLRAIIDIYILKKW